MSSSVASVAVSERQRRAVELRLEGWTYIRIGVELGVSKGRAEQLVKLGQRSGEYQAHIQVTDTEGVDQQLVARAVRRAAERLGLTVGPIERDSPES